MAFSQKALQDLLGELVNGNKKTVIFASSQEQAIIERELLSLSNSQAFMHMQVTSWQNYLLNLLEKQGRFDVHLLPKALGYHYICEVLKMPHLSYFKNLGLDAGMIVELWNTFNKMSDLDLKKVVKREGMSEKKWQELEMMYDYFNHLRQNALLPVELYQVCMDYQEPDVFYLDLSHEVDGYYKKQLKTAWQVQTENDFVFSKTPLDLVYHTAKPGVVADLPMTLYNVQFAHQEYQLVYEMMTSLLSKGARYQDFLVYVPNSETMTDFIHDCPYPCRYELVSDKSYQLAFLNHLWDYLKDGKDLASLAMLAGMEEDVMISWLADFKVAKVSGKLAMLADVVDAKLVVDLADLPDDIALSDFVVLAKMLVSANGLEMHPGMDRIEVTTYDAPILAKAYDDVFCLGMNEDVYPSKISDKGLLLNAELQSYYPDGMTPLDRVNEWEWQNFRNIIDTAKHLVVTCHFGSLAGESVLPSLLFKHLMDLKGIKEAPSYSFSEEEVKEDEILATFEKQKAQPQPLSPALAKKLYQKHDTFQMSPSEMESYNKCPYQHFLTYGMKFKVKTKDMAVRASFGTLMHEMLDHFACLFGFPFEERLAKMEAKYQLSSDGSLDDRLESLVNAVLKSLNFVCETAEEKYLYQLFPEQFLNTLKVLLYHLGQGQFELCFHEQAICRHEDFGDYRGYVDRADRYQDYVKIIDYKSSQKSIELGLALQGFNIQMLVYLDMLSRQEKLENGAVLYFNTSPRKLASAYSMDLEGTNDKDFLKAYQMRGLILADERHEVMYGIDKNFPESLVAKISYVKSSNDYKGDLISKEQFDHLLSLIFSHLHDLVDACFMNGDISIYPAGSKEGAINMKVSPCAYCPFRNVCLRDPFYHEAREILNLAKEEVAEIINEGVWPDEYRHEFK